MWLKRARRRWAGKAVVLSDGSPARVADVYQTDGWRNPDQDFAYDLVLDSGTRVHWSEVEVCDEPPTVDLGGTP